MALFLHVCHRDEDEMQKIYQAELSFLESCLKVNPKSYGSWHHRGWVSARLPRPDWARELSLCDRCLSLDDRNCESKREVTWFSYKKNVITFMSHPCFVVTVSMIQFSPIYPSPLLGLPPAGCENIRRSREAGIGLHGSSHRLQLFQLLQLALPQHPATPAPPGDS